MGNLFSYDSPLIRGLNWLADIVLLNILFLASSLPIITIGASITAMYYVTGRRLRNEGTLWKDYWHAFRSNWKSATLLWIISLAFGLLVGFGFFYYLLSTFHGVNFVLFLLGLAFCFWGGTSIWSFLLLSFFDNTVSQTIKNALRCSIVFFTKTVVAVILNMTPFVVLIAFTKEFFQASMFWLFFWFAFSAWLTLVLMKKPIARLKEKSLSASCEDQKP